MTSASEAVTRGGETARRILDAAEALFASQGYRATSLGQVADRVGIRAPSLYNHFRNKEALYVAVLDRLVEDFSGALRAIEQGPVTRERVTAWLEAVARHHHRKPNLARLLQHAALSGGPQAGQLIERLFWPMFNSAHGTELEGSGMPRIIDAGLQPWAVMAFNNLVMSYVTMAPMYADVLGVDPFAEEALDKQLELIHRLLNAIFDYRGEPAQ